MNKLLILSLLLLSCGNGTEIKKDLDKLCLKPITIPTGLTVNYNGSDSNINVLNNTYLKFVVYIDSVSCSSCYVNKMYLWQPFLKYSDTFD